jgi:hypothetical protein
MQVLLGAATFFFYCCRVTAFGSQDLDLKTSIFGSQDLGFRTQIDRHWVSGPGRTHTRVGVMAAGSRWSVISVAESTIENAPRTSSDRRTDATSDFIYKMRQVVRAKLWHFSKCDKQNSLLAFSSLVRVASRVYWPITNRLPTAKQFGTNFSILLHFE